MGCSNVHPQSHQSEQRKPAIMNRYKLCYFNGRAIGETTRLIFVQAGEPFEDFRIEMSDWPAYKTEMPLGQLPVLEFDGVQYPQSLAIGRYVARKVVYSLSHSHIHLTTSQFIYF